MKLPLYEVPNDTYVTIDIGDGCPDKFLFKKVDGMFAICHSEQYGEQYIKATTRVTIVKD